MERVLAVGGRPIELGARAFDLLLVLVEYHGRLATKATLIERVWPRVIVDENNLPAQIASLRRVLGPGAIRTVAGFGYRLELAVSTSAAAESPTSPSTPEAARPAITVPRRSWPNRLGPLIGRERDLRDLTEALARACLVSIVGVAGAGKTRLAQQILAGAADQPDMAVAWVQLQSVTAAELVPQPLRSHLDWHCPRAWKDLPPGGRRWSGCRCY